jgi:hypothetical protein
MKGILYKSKEGWMVKYTTYKTIPGIKGVMGSHSRMPESNYLPVHPDTKLYPDGLWGQANVGEFETVDFEIVEIIAPVEDGTTMYKCANLINEEKHFKRRKQERAVTQDIVDEAMRIAGKDVRAPKCVRDGIVKRMYTEEDLINGILFGMQKGLNVGKVEETDNDWVRNYVRSINRE